MESTAKTRELREKINKLQNLVEDFVDSINAKKNKIRNLETEIQDIKRNMNKYLDDLEELNNQK
tara:strand:+ start:1349 stop:1540 length:192 start_codon:yes stop_codon:yes gene_type:complete